MFVNQQGFRMLLDGAEHLGVNWTHSHYDHSPMSLQHGWLHMRCRSSQQLVTDQSICSFVNGFALNVTFCFVASDSC